MNELNQAPKEQWSFPESIPSRRDKVTAAIVKKGILLQERYGTKFAAEYLKAKQIDISIVMRVLLNPSRRRRYDDLDELPVNEAATRPQDA